MVQNRAVAITHDLEMSENGRSGDQKVSSWQSEGIKRVINNHLPPIRSFNATIKKQLETTTTTVKSLVLY